MSKKRLGESWGRNLVMNLEIRRQLGLAVLQDRIVRRVVYRTRHGGNDSKPLPYHVPFIVAKSTHHEGTRTAEAEFSIS